MAQVTVSDYALWIKHIHGDEELRRVLHALPPEATVRLRIAGEVGIWRKMSAYRTSGRTTPGLSPLGAAQMRWRSLYRQHKPHGGAVVEIELAPDGSGESAASREGSGTASGERPSEAERQAAWEAFLALTNAGWRSDVPYGPREELYDRDER